MKRQLMKRVRALAYTVVVLLAFGALAARSAYADLARSGLALGHELGALGDGPTRPIRLNGERLFVAAHVEAISVREALDRMEAACRTSSAALLADMGDLTDVAKRALPEGGAEASGILREARAGRGYVACFARDADDAPTFADFAQRLRRVATTGDLGAVGRLRYLYAEALPDGKARLVGAWTEGSFNLHALVPTGGDAPGSDARDVPRPRDATRVLTADVEGAPYAIRLYRSDVSPAEAISTYETEMPRRGFVPLPAGSDDMAAHTLAYHRSDSDVILTASRAGASTVVSVIELPSGR